MDLSIDIDQKSKSTTLKACLDAYFEPEKMADSGFKCNKCKKEVDIEKTTSIF